MSLRAIFTDSKGNQKLIRVPWYAALAGASPTRPPTPDPNNKSNDKSCGACKGQGKCSGCGGKGKVSSKGADKNQKGGGGGGGKDEGKKSGDNKNFSTSDTETYTDAEDQTIIEMKTAGKTWKEILTAIEHRSESQLKNHWKTNLQARAEGKEGGGGGDGNDSTIDDKNANAGTGNDGRKGRAKKGGLDEQMAKELEKQEARKWENMASRHFDKTGERISAVEAKKRYAKKYYEVPVPAACSESMPTGASRFFDVLMFSSHHAGAHGLRFVVPPEEVIAPVEICPAPLITFLMDPH